MKQILKVLVGSRAHHLDNDNSDYDYRGVTLQPTSELLKIGAQKPKTDWNEKEEHDKDETNWELGHFMFLATKCNPTILECFLAPIIETTDEGNELRSQFSRVWNARGVFEAFRGYGFNQRKKFLDQKDNRPHKYAVAYLRTLFNAWELLSMGTFSVDMSLTTIYETLKRFKQGDYEIGEVIQATWRWENNVKSAYEHNQDKLTDFDQLNTFLLKIRKRNF